MRIKKNKARKAEVSKSRRKFLQLGGGALATAVATTLPSVGCSTSGAGVSWSATFDWVCVGSGVAGCVAAVAGHDRGLKTVVLEKMDKLGGITSQAGGAFWVPMSHLAKSAGIQDSREAALKYLEFLGGGYAVREIMEAFVDNVARVTEYLHQKAEIPFRLGQGSEFYYPIAPGTMKSGRILGVEPFRSEELGEWRNKVLMAVYYRGFMEAGQREGSEGGPGPSRNPEARLEERLAEWRNRLGAEKVEAILKENDDVRMGGAALLGYLVRAMLKRGIEIRTGAKVERLLVEGDRVIGVTVNNQGKEENIRANRGVVLATGGDALGLDRPTAWKLALQARAMAVGRPTIIPQLIVPIPGEKYPDGSPAGRVNHELTMTHGLAVNRFGKRFGNEAFFQAIGSKLNHFDYIEHRFVNYPFYFVFDQEYVDQHGFGGWPRGVTKGLEWVTQARTLGELAQKMGFPPAALEDTVRRFNEHVRRGKDLDFDRDPKSLGTVSKPPYYALKVYTPDPNEVDVRVTVTTHGQAIQETTKQPIPGLYACGSAMAISDMFGFGYQAGHSLASGATFAFLAAEHAAAAVS